MEHAVFSCGRSSMRITKSWGDFAVCAEFKTPLGGLFCGHETVPAIRRDVRDPLGMRHPSYSATAEQVCVSELMVCTCFGTSEFLHELVDRSQGDNWRRWGPAVKLAIRHLSEGSQCRRITMRQAVFAVINLYRFLDLKVKGIIAQALA